MREVLRSGSPRLSAWLGLCLALGCSAPAPDGAPRVVLVGLDGADWETIHALFEAGRLPHLEALVEGGASGVLHTVEPMLSPMLWTSIATGRTAGLRAVRGLALPPDQLDYALVSLGTQSYPELEVELGAMRDLGAYVKFVFPPNAAIVGIPPRWHAAETDFYQAALERSWRVTRDLVDERVLSESTGVREDVFKLWNVNYMGAGVLYGIQPAAPLRFGGEKREKSLERFRERRRKGLETSLAERASGDSGGAALAEPAAVTASIGDLVEGPPCGSVVHGPTGIRYDPIEYALGSWVVTLVTPETRPDGVGGVITNAEEEWNDSPSDELLQVKSMLLTATNDMIDGITGGLTFGYMTVVFNFEDQVRTCCGQGRSDAECNRPRWPAS